ncbi:MAG: hypothetical protein SVT52_06575 [Planctomycetota bacterium]|nr:hypothetical protein [Planctomycetota bacterium]
MTCKTSFLAILLAAVLLSCGCTSSVPRPPQNMAEYERMRQDTSNAYPNQTIVLHNLQRVLDEEVEVSQRIESLRLAGALGGENPETYARMAELLRRNETPVELKTAVMEFLLKKDYPTLASHVTAALPDVEPGSGLRETMLDWLIRHPAPDVLAEVVKLWAKETSTTGTNETRFRRLTERMTGKTWEEALLTLINAPATSGRGSAIKVLSQRVPTYRLRNNIERTTAKTEAFVALQTFLKWFNYMPTSGAEFVTAVTLYKMQNEMLDDAAALYRRWFGDYDYRFNIRDFHLLSRLSRDPLRPMLRRTQLVMELTQAFSMREHVYRNGESRLRAHDVASQLEQLNMSDLWNLYLLDEMLSRPRVQLQLRQTSQCDRADRGSVWGGLVFYRNGQAEALLYPASQQPPTNDLSYNPSHKLLFDGRDAICRFVGHFEQVENAGRAGPEPDELSRARNQNIYLLIFTSISDEVFCAHYVNPDGTVISLGTFPFSK